MPNLPVEGLQATHFCHMSALEESNVVFKQETYSPNSPPAPFGAPASPPLR